MIYVKDSQGRMIPKFNPAEKAYNYARALKTGEYYHVRKNRTIKLTEKQKAYMQGYLDARKDQAEAYKHNQKKMSLLEKIGEWWNS